MTTATRLTLDIDLGPQADEEELERATRRLRDELTQLDVESVDLVRAGDVPERAKFGDPISWGSLIVDLIASNGALATFINAVASWLGRNERCSVTLKIGGDKLMLTGVKPEERRQLIDAWIRRHEQTSPK